MIPQIIYACSTWAYRKNLKKSTWQKFQTIQGKAARIITGAYRGTSLQACDVEAYLQPIEDIIQQTALLAALKVYSSPVYLELKARQGKDFRPDAPQPRTSLQAWIAILDKDFGCRNRLEPFQPYIVMPDWIPPPTTIQSREQARKMVEKIEGKELLTIYTDGSGISEKIGASFVLSSGSEGRYVGTEKEYTEYAAELCGIYEAIRAISNTRLDTRHQNPRIFHIFTDNQAAIQAFRDPASHIRSGQVIIDGIVQYLNFLYIRGTRVIIHWIPAHEGFPGNEQADQEAKKATGWRLQNGKGVDTSDIIPKAYHSGYQLTVKVKQAIKQHYQRQWQRKWSYADHGADLRRICPSPTKEILTVYQGTSRYQSSVITQLRTGKIGLASFLYSQKVPGIESGICTVCKREDQTVGHVLLRCPALQGRRNQMWKAIDKSDHWNRPSLPLLLTWYAKQAAKFIQDTRLIRQYQPID